MIRRWIVVVDRGSWIDILRGARAHAGVLEEATEKGFSLLRIFFQRLKSGYIFDVFGRD